MKIGISTGGGDCPGLNACLRAVVKHAIGTYGMEVVGISDSFNGLMNRPIDVKPVRLDDVTHMLSRGGTFLGTTNQGNPFQFLGPSQTKPCDKSQMVLEGYKQTGLDGIVVVGGDGTQSIAHQLISLGLNIVGVPKTIDNDLAGTDETIGFQTAVEIAADAISRLQTTAESHDRIMVLEVMGRDAGHIALHSGIAGGANIILLPEIPFSYDAIVKKIEERKKRGRYFSIVVVSEGAFEVGASPSMQTVTTSTHQPKNLGGIGSVVAQVLHDKTGIDSRVTVLGHVQRGGSPCHYDRVLASGFGIHAVELIKQKKFGRVVVKQKGRFTDIPYSDVSGKSRPLSLDSEYIKTAEALGISLGR